MRGSRVVLAVLAAAAAGCNPEDRCLSDAQCGSSEAACRRNVERCRGEETVVMLSPGSCRDRGASCGKDLDCVPDETCQLGTCKPDPTLCSGAPPTCPPGCPWTRPFPCACVCPVCP